MTKKTFIVLSVLSIICVGLFATSTVLAQDTDTNPTSSLVLKIVEKFGLNKDEVQAVFDADRSERQDQMQIEFEKKLAQDVTDGKITEAQKNLIIAKRKELEESRQSNMDSRKELTNEERKTAMEKEKTELESWASQNNIDLKYLMGGGRHGGQDSAWSRPREAKPASE